MEKTVRASFCSSALAQKSSTKVPGLGKEHSPARDPQRLSCVAGPLFGFTASAGTQHPGPVGFSLTCTALSSGQTKTLSKENINGARLIGTSVTRLLQKSVHAAKSHGCSPGFSPDAHPLLLRSHTSAISQCHFSWEKLLPRVSPTFFWEKFSSLHSQAVLFHPNASGRPLAFGASLPPLSPSSSLPSTVSPSYFPKAARRKSKNKVLRPHQCNPSKPGLMAFSFAGLAYP